MTGSALASLTDWLAEVPHRVIACSGGVDSMLLATIAHRMSPATTTIVHDVTPAVPARATARVADHADLEQWNLQLVTSEEFNDQRYLANPRNRCYFCKSHLYETVTRIASTLDHGTTLLSGANADDLGEYRPGLRAADEYGVRHPYVELSIGKSDIRSLATQLGLPFADLAASPCLASRLYTGTPVTPARLRAVEVGEDVLRQRTGLAIVRCRIDGTSVRVEVTEADQHCLNDEVLRAVLGAMKRLEPQLNKIVPDLRGYKPGRAFELPVLA